MLVDFKNGSEFTPSRFNRLKIIRTDFYLLIYIPDEVAYEFPLDKKSK